MNLLWIPILAAIGVCAFFGILYGNNIARYGFMDDNCKISRNQARAIMVISIFVCIAAIAAVVIVASQYEGLPQ